MPGRQRLPRPPPPAEARRFGRPCRAPQTPSHRRTARGRRADLAGDAAFGSRASMADRGEGQLNDVRGSKMCPVRGGEVVERKQTRRGREPGRRWPWGYLSSYRSSHWSKARSAFALVSALQISCSPCLAFAWPDLGREFRTFPVLCIQQRCVRVDGNTSDSAAQNPSAPSPTASFAGRVKPRCEPPAFARTGLPASHPRPRATVASSAACVPSVAPGTPPVPLATLPSRPPCHQTRAEQARPRRRPVRLAPRLAMR